MKIDADGAVKLAEEAAALRAACQKEKEQLALARKEHAELEDVLREMHDQLEAARADAAEARASSLAALGSSLPSAAGAESPGDAKLDASFDMDDERPRRPRRPLPPCR